MLDFAMVPPEVNSSRMYAGPGTGSLLAAATSWDQLSAELESTAARYGSVVSGLTSLQWMGPASQSMAAAATPYLGWLSTTAVQVQQTASQAMAAAAAFEQAYGMTVPPALVAANRSLLASLVASNIVGQNTPAIMATEAHYAEMWAQDAAAMYDYTANSAGATQLTPFASPQQTTNAAGVTAQNTAVTNAATAAATQASSAGSTGSTGSTAATAVPIVPDDFTVLDGILASYSSVAGANNLESMAVNPINAEKNYLDILVDEGRLWPAAGHAEQEAAGLGTLTAIGNATPAGVGGVSAAMGNAGRLGAMSVPAGWAPPVTAATVKEFSQMPLGTQPVAEVAEAAAPGMAGMPGTPGMAMTGSGRGAGILPRYGTRLTVMPRVLVGG